jgi:hypothetical protein
MASEFSGEEDRAEFGPPRDHCALLILTAGQVVADRLGPTALRATRR